MKHNYMEFFPYFFYVFRLDPNNLFFTSLSNSHKNDIHIYCEKPNLKRIQNNA